MSDLKTGRRMGKRQNVAALLEKDKHHA